MSIRDEARQEAERRWPVEEKTTMAWASRRIGFEEGAVWAREQDARDPSEPVSVQIAARRGGKHSTLADMIVERANTRGVRVEFVAPDGEPSDAEVEAAAHAIYDHDAESLTCYDHDDTCCPCGTHDMGRAEWQAHRARAVLLAAQEVRNRG